MKTEQEKRNETEQQVSIKSKVELFNKIVNSIVNLTESSGDCYTVGSIVDTPQSLLAIELTYLANYSEKYAAEDYDETRKAYFSEYETDVEIILDMCNLYC